MNRKGAGKCFSANDCSVGRTCNAKGTCEDKPKPIVALADPPKILKPAAVEKPAWVKPAAKKDEKKEVKKDDKKNENCVVLYSKCDFKGKSISICEDTPHLGHKGWTVKIRSIRIPEGYEVYLYTNTYY